VVVSITTSSSTIHLGIHGLDPHDHKGGIDAISRNLAMEYAKEGIRVNTVAPGIVDTPLHKNDPKEFLQTLSPLGQIAASQDIAEAVFYLTQASQVTGEVLARRRRRGTSADGKHPRQYHQSNRSRSCRLKRYSIRPEPRPPAAVATTAVRSRPTALRGRPSPRGLVRWAGRRVQAPILSSSFAAGYSACFLSAMRFVARRDNRLRFPRTPPVETPPRFPGHSGNGFGLEAELRVSLPGLRARG